MHCSKRRNKSFSHHVKRSGEELALSSINNKNCSKYLEGLNLMTPEKLKYKKSKDKDAKMKTVKSGRNKSEDEKEEAKKNPTLIGEIRLDTGKLQIGYDEKTKKIVFSFVQDELQSDQKEVVENCAFEQYAYERETFKSRDINFYQRAVSGRCDIDKSRFMLERQFDVISDKKCNNTMIDRVLPFHQVKAEKDQLEQLKAMKSSSDNDRSNIHTAMSTVKTAQYKKEQRKLDFSQKFIEAIEDAKRLAKLKNKTKDDSEEEEKKKEEELEEKKDDDLNVIDDADKVSESADNGSDDFFVYLNKKKLVAEALGELEELLQQEEESEEETKDENQKVAEGPAKEESEEGKAHIGEEVAQEPSGKSEESSGNMSKE